VSGPTKDPPGRRCRNRSNRSSRRGSVWSTADVFDVAAMEEVVAEEGKWKKWSPKKAKYRVTVMTRERGQTRKCRT
jgi:hypothetical protein